MTEEEPQQKGFYSPFFNEYKSLAFYSKLLTTILQYARSVDSAGRNLRHLVWKELCQFAGRPAPSDDSLEDVETTMHLEPFINNLLRLPSVNLVSLEIVYESFLQAQRRYPDVFCNMFFPIGEGSTERGGRHPDTLWGNSIQSALMQLNLLTYWIPTLEKLPPVQKKVIWDTCRLVPTFHAPELVSFRKTILGWTFDPLQNTSNITVMFGAIAFLSFLNIIKHEFYYPNVRVSVFTKEGQSAQSTKPGPLAKTPPSKRSRRNSVTVAAAAAAAAIAAVAAEETTPTSEDQAPAQPQPQPPQQQSELGVSQLGLNLASYQTMLENAGLATVSKTGKHLIPQNLAPALSSQSIAETVERIAAVRRQAGAMGIPTMSGSPEVTSALESLMAAVPRAQQNPEHLISATQNLATMQHIPPGGINAAILSLPAPTQSAPAAVTASAATVTETVSQLIPLPHNVTSATPQ